MSVPLPHFSGSLADDWILFANAFESWQSLYEIEEDSDKLALLFLAITGPAASWLVQRGRPATFQAAWDLLSNRYGSPLRKQCQQLAARNSLCARKFRDASHAREHVATLTDDVVGMMARAGVESEGEMMQLLLSSFVDFPTAVNMLEQAISFEHSILQALTWESLIIAESAKTQRQQQSPGEGSAAESMVAQSIVDPVYTFPQVPRLNDRRTIRDDRASSRSQPIGRIYRPPTPFEPSLATNRVGRATMAEPPTLYDNAVLGRLRSAEVQPLEQNDAEFRVLDISGPPAVPRTPVVSRFPAAEPRREHLSFTSYDLWPRPSKRTRGVQGTISAPAGGERAKSSRGSRITGFLSGSFRRRASSEAQGDIVPGGSSWFDA